MILPSFFFVLSLTAHAQIAIFYVDDDYQGSDPNWFNNIQDAVDAADASTIIVYPGIYNENVEINEGKRVQLISREDYSVTIIDGGQNGPAVTFHRSLPGCKIDGFTIQNGSGKPVTGFGICGGGIYCENASPEIKNNLIWFNEAEDKGGGIFCYYNLENQNPCAPVIVRNRIENNLAGNRGGGICCWQIQHLVTIQNNNLNDNYAEGEGGGGIYIRGNSIFSSTRSSIYPHPPFPPVRIRGTTTPRASPGATRRFLLGTMTANRGSSTVSWTWVPTRFSSDETNRVPM